MAAKKTRPDPNVADPLSEPTVQRRLWAAYLRAGFTRGSFARALDVRYATVDSWDTGASMPSDLVVFARAAELVGFSTDELIYGHRAKGTLRLEPELSRDAIKELLTELDATGEQRVAFGEHAAGPAGSFQRFTRTYCSTFVSAYAAAIEGGTKHAAAIEHAMVEATRARATADAVARGAKPVVSSSESKQGLRPDAAHKPPAPPPP